MDKNDNLQTNRTVNKFFNKSEIKDLQTILDFFENQICNTEKIEDEFKFDCYHVFFRRLDSLEVIGDVDIKISFEAQRQLYQQIEQNTFNQIWKFGKAGLEPPYDTLNQISLRYDGKYIEFLEELGHEDKLLKNYYESFIAAGTISPDSIAHLLKMYNDYDIKDIRVRLLISIHYLTLNDQFERKEKYPN